MIHTYTHTHIWRESQTGGVNFTVSLNLSHLFVLTPSHHNGIFGPVTHFWHQHNVYAVLLPECFECCAFILLWMTSVVQRLLWNNASLSVLILLNAEKIHINTDTARNFEIFTVTYNILWLDYTFKILLYLQHSKWFILLCKYCILQKGGWKI